MKQETCVVCGQLMSYAYWVGNKPYCDRCDPNKQEPREGAEWKVKRRTDTTEVLAWVGVAILIAVLVLGTLFDGPFPHGR